MISNCLSSAGTPRCFYKVWTFRDVCVWGGAEHNSSGEDQTRGPLDQTKIHPLPSALSLPNPRTPLHCLGLQ